jgi:hypothetical protein
MAKPGARLVIVCEDSVHESFLLRFAKEHLGVSGRDVRSRKAPRGGGCGAQYVQRNFVGELEQLRKRRVRTALVAITDDDKQGRRALILKACGNAGLPPPGPKEPVLLLVPERALVSWLAYARGDDDEGREPRVGEAREWASLLVEMCDAGELREPAPSSLREACEDYQRFREVWNTLMS